MACVLASALLGAGGAVASGGGSGGGGGGGSSMGGGGMGPMYNPNEEYQKGLAALKAQNFKAAVTAFDHVISVVPKDSNTWTLMGMSKAGAGDGRGARAAYEKAIHFNADNVIAHGELGQTNAKLGDAAKARAELEWLKKKSDACADACKEAGDLKSETAKLQASLAGGGATAPGAGAPHASLLFEGPKGGEQAYVQAVALINAGRYEDALASLHKSEQAIGPHPDILTYMGFASRKLHRYDQAEAYYTAALQVDPNHVGATEYYGELKVERGDLKSAGKLLARLDDICGFGCSEAEELRSWIDRARAHGS